MAGDVINDVLVETPATVVTGEDNAASVRVRPGGSAANQAAWMGHCGLDVVFAGRVGGLDAEFHRRELARFGVAARLAVDESVSTGSIVVLVEADGERTMVTDRGANLRLAAADVPFTLLDGVALLHLTGYTLFEPGSRAVARALIAEARARGIPFTVDPGSAAFLAALAPGDFIRWTEGAAVCFPNRDEAATLTGQASSAGLDEAAGRAVNADLAAMAAALAGHYEAVALKLGPDGVLLATDGERPRRLPAHPAVVRDTTGAGDAFCAGFIAAWLGGAGLVAAAAAGAASAAAAVAILGGRPPALHHDGRLHVRGRDGVRRNVQLDALAPVAEGDLLGVAARPGYLIAQRTAVAGRHVEGDPRGGRQVHAGRGVPSHAHRLLAGYGRRRGHGEPSGGRHLGRDGRERDPAGNVVEAARAQLLAAPDRYPLARLQAGDSCRDPDELQQAGRVAGDVPDAANEHDRHAPARAGPDHLPATTGRGLVGVGDRFPGRGDGDVEVHRLAGLDVGQGGRQHGGGRPLRQRGQAAGVGGASQQQPKPGQRR